MVFSYFWWREWQSNENDESFGDEYSLIDVENEIKFERWNDDVIDWWNYMFILEKNLFF